MPKQIIFLSPVYVTAFFAIILNLKGRNSTPVKLFLGKFMICACIIYISHFIFYYPFPILYSYIDPLYQLSSLLVYPMYFIYIRILTVDETTMQNHKLDEKLIDLFKNKKIYLKEDLNIVHLANITGSNRTYISHFINKHYQQNFCSFVNSYRIRELTNYLKTDPNATNQNLAEKCGFSSVDSLKRVVKNQTSMSVTELKKSLFN